MERRIIAVAVVLVASLGLCLSLQAELTPGQKLAAEALIKQFTHRDFPVREHAVNTLIALGPDVVPLIKKTLAETTDNEVKLRCEMVLKGIEKKYGTTVGLDTKKTAKDWGLDVSKVTIKMRDADLDQIIEALSEQSGNTLVALPEAWEGKRLTLEVTDMPYWQALDALCAQAKLTYVTDYQNGGLKLVAAPESDDVSAYAGPAVLKVDSATRMRSFRGPAPQRIRNVANLGLTNSLNYRFSLFYEDRLHPIVAEASFTSAAAPDGTALKLTQMTGRTFVGVLGGGGRRRTASGQVYANITDVPVNLQKVTELKGVVKLVLGEGEKSLKVENALAQGEKSGTLDETTLTVTNANRMRNWATLQVKMAVNGKDAEIPRYPAGSPYGFFLIDPNGERHRGTSYGSFGLMRRGRNAPAGGGNVGGGRQRRRGRNRRERGAVNEDANEKAKEEAAAPVGGGKVETVLEADVVEVVVQADVGGVVMVREGPGDANIVVAQADPGVRPGGQRGQRGQRQPGARAAQFVQRVAGQSNVTFTGLPDIAGAWTLLYTMPAKSTEKEFPFTFKDIPLP